MYHFHLACVLISLITIRLCNTSVYRTFNIQEVVTLRNTTFTESFLAKLPTDSLISCAALCGYDEACVSFTYSHKGCRLHSAKFGNPGDADQDWKYYIFL